MIDVRVDPGSAGDIADHFAAVRERILQAARDGMREGMEGLAKTVVGKLGGDPITSRSGDLLDAVERSPRVWENSDTIGGDVSADPEQRNLDIWLEYGHEFPGKRKRFFESRNLRNHPRLTPLALERRMADDRVAAHPFLNPSLQEYGPTILEIIQQKVADAVE